MENNALPSPGRLPLLAPGNGKKDFFSLAEDGSLKYYTCRGKSWASPAENLLQEGVNGFDIVLENPGKAHLLAHSSEEKLLHLIISGEKERERAVIFQDKKKKITHLSCCIDAEKGLHLLYLTVDEKRNMWWLNYQRYREGRWSEPCLLDFGYEHLEHYGLIGLQEDNPFVLYRLYTEGSYLPVFRSIERESGRAGKTLYLGKRNRDSFYPSFLVTPDNTLHISWISCQEGSYFLNYVQRRASGLWGEPLSSVEVALGTESPILIYLLAAGRLGLAWKRKNQLVYLFSPDGGKRWNWGGKCSLPLEATLIRCRLPRFPEKPCSWQGNYIFCSGSPPREIWEPGLLLLEDPEREKRVPEIDTLKALSFLLVTRADNMQKANSQLKLKLEEKEKELSRIHAWSMSRVKSLEEKLAAKKMELAEIEGYFQKTLKELQERVAREKKEFLLANSELQKKIDLLQQENEELRERITGQLRKIVRLKEEKAALEKENEELKRKKNRFISFFLR